MHQGFYLAYNDVKLQVHEYVAAMKQRYPTATLLFTGHSLGQLEFSILSNEFMVRIYA